MATVNKGLDTGKYILGVVLLNKLEPYGIKSNILKWFTIDLSYKSQYVEYNGKNSEKIYINHGVPRDQYWDPYFIYYMLTTFFCMRQSTNIFLNIDIFSLFITCELYLIIICIIIKI